MGAGITRARVISGAHAIVGAFFGAIALPEAVSVVGALAYAGNSVVAGAIGIGVVVAVVALSSRMGKAIRYRLRGPFLWLFLPAMIIACLTAANLLSPLHSWKLIGSALLFLVLLTLLNAPFDWASLPPRHPRTNRRGEDKQAGGALRPGELDK
jgi:hypothetical protein